jgi:hypothetical protein
MHVAMPHTLDTGSEEGHATGIHFREKAHQAAMLNGLPTGEVQAVIRQGDQFA